MDHLMFENFRTDVTRSRETYSMIWPPAAARLAGVKIELCVQATLHHLHPLPGPRTTCPVSGQHEGETGWSSVALLLVG